MLPTGKPSPSVARPYPRRLCARGGRGLPFSGNKSVDQILLREANTRSTNQRCFSSPAGQVPGHPTKSSGPAPEKVFAARDVAASGDRQKSQSTDLVARKVSAPTGRRGKDGAASGSSRSGSSPPARSAFHRSPEEGSPRLVASCRLASLRPGRRPDGSRLRTRTVPRGTSHRA